MRKLCVLLASMLALLVLAQPALALEDASAFDTTWNGAVTIETDKEVFDAGEEITGMIRIHNSEEYPLVGQRIVLHLAQGTYDYPSQLNNEDNILLEETINDIWVLPGDYVDLPFALEGQAGGQYRIDLYSWVTKSKFIGSSSILLAPVSAEFEVTGAEKEEAVIFRELTIFENRFTGPVGFPVEPGEKVSGTVYVYNPTQETKSNLKLGVAVCEWAAVFCDELEEEMFDVPDVVPGDELGVVVSLAAPDMPSAYAVQLTLYDGDEIESIYKSRIIVTGGTAKARKIHLDGLETGDYSLTVYFAGSPDHFNYPDFNNFSVGMEIYEEGALLEEKSTEVESIATGQTMKETFGIAAKAFDYVCVKIRKGPEVFDEECFIAEIEEIQEAYDAAHPPLVEVDWSYNDAKENLTLNLEREGEMDVRIIIFTTEKTVYENTFDGGEKFSDTFYLPIENYTMIVDDFGAKKQQVFELFFNVETQLQGSEIIGDVPADFREPGPCTGTVCGQGTVCSGITYDSLDGACCTASCVPSSMVLGEGVLAVPLILWVALIFVVIAAFMGSRAIRKVRK